MSNNDVNSTIFLEQYVPCNRFVLFFFERCFQHSKLKYKVSVHSDSESPVCWIYSLPSFNPYIANPLFTKPNVVTSENSLQFYQKCILIPPKWAFKRNLPVPSTRVGGEPVLVGTLVPSWSKMICLSSSIKDCGEWVRTGILALSSKRRVQTNSLTRVIGVPALDGILALSCNEFQQTEIKLRHLKLKANHSLLLFSASSRHIHWSSQSIVRSTTANWSTSGPKVSVPATPIPRGHNW